MRRSKEWIKREEELRRERWELWQITFLSDHSAESEARKARIKEITAMLIDMGASKPSKPDGRKGHRPPRVVNR